MKLKPIVFGVIATMSLSVNATPLYSSSFTDNGNKVTEVRTFEGNRIETWEWLDLTVTNGVGYNSLIADLVNDGKLNNSDNVLVANAGALEDISALDIDDQAGWETQSILKIANLFNNYFNLSLVENGQYPYGSNVSIVEDFIKSFGDTMHEGLTDQGYIWVNINPEGPVGLIKGMTETVGNNYSQRVRLAPSVTDGQYFYSNGDNEPDHIHLANVIYLGNPPVTFESGTWLAREVVPASAPATAALFALALVGLGLRRRLM